MIMFSLHLKGLVNHRPLSLLPIPSSATKHLLPTLLSMALSLKHDACLAAVADSSYTKQTFCFGPTGSETQLTLPLPNGAAGGQSTGQTLSITCARISLALSLPFPPHPHPNLWQYLHHACAGLRCNLSLPLLSFCSYSREAKAVIAPAEAKHKAFAPKAASSEPLQKAAAASAGGGSRTRRL